MNLVSLKKVVSIERKAVQPEEIKSGTLYVGLEHITSDGKFRNLKSVEVGDIKSSKFHFGTQHVLYGKLRPYLQKVVIPDFQGICSTDILPLLPKSGLDQRYLFHWLRLPEVVELATSRSTGINLPRISPQQLLEFQIPLPPLPEQKRIAAILDKAGELRQKRRRSLALLDDLLQSVFLEMFGNPVRNPKGWKVVKLNTVVSHVSSGSTPKGGSSVYLDSGHLFIRSQNVLMFDFDFSDAAYISNEIHHSMRRTWVKNNDVLLNITGASIGRVNYFQGQDNWANVNQHVCIIRPNISKIVPEFLTYHLGMPSFQSKVLGLNRGATRQAFNYQQIKSFEIMLPPMELQKQFSLQIQSIISLKNQLHIGQSRLEDLFYSIQKEVFNTK